MELSFAKNILFTANETFVKAEFYAQTMINVTLNEIANVEKQINETANSKIASCLRSKIPLLDGFIKQIEGVRSCLGNLNKLRSQLTNEILTNGQFQFSLFPHIPTDVIPKIIEFSKGIAKCIPKPNFTTPSLKPPVDINSCFRL